MDEMLFRGEKLLFLGCEMVEMKPVTQKKKERTEKKSCIIEIVQYA